MFNYGSGGAARGAAAQATSQQVDRHPGLGLGFANLMVFLFLILTWQGYHVKRE